MKGKKLATAAQEPPEARKSGKEQKLRRLNLSRPLRPAVREGKSLNDLSDQRAWMDW